MKSSFRRDFHDVGFGDFDCCEDFKDSYLSHCLSIQLAMIQRDTMKTSSTVPGQIVIKVFITNRVLKLIRLRAPIEREDASVNNLE